MKRILVQIFIFPVLLLTCHKSDAQDIVVSYQTFYDDLSPYGEWINDSEYGYIWVPNVDDDFRPYFTNGHWVMTEFGNTWVSNYPWGWACFHYGRWIYNDFYRWIWLPGYEWGPGWVAWRWGNGLCGWAPLYPGIVWTGSVYTCPEDWWIFIHPRHLYRPVYRNSWRRDFLHGPRHTHALIEHSHFVVNVYEHGMTRFFSGPRAAEVQQATHQPVRVYSYGNTTARGSERIENNEIHTFRPVRIDRVNVNGSVPVPSRSIPATKQVTRPAELRTNRNQPRQFKVDQQQKNRQWQRPFIRNAPSYSPNQQPTRRSDYQRNPNPGSRPAPKRSGERQAPKTEPNSSPKHRWITNFI